MFRRKSGSRVQFRQENRQRPVETRLPWSAGYLRLVARWTRDGRPRNGRGEQGRRLTWTLAGWRTKTRGHDRDGRSQQGGDRRGDVDVPLDGGAEQTAQEILGLDAER